MAESDVQIGRRIAALREERGWSQPELARRLGLAQQTLSNYERLHRKIPVQTLTRIAGCLGVQVGDLLAETPRAGFDERLRVPCLCCVLLHPEHEARVAALEHLVEHWKHMWIEAAVTLDLMLGRPLAIVHQAMLDRERSGGR